MPRLHTQFVVRSGRQRERRPVRLLWRRESDEGGRDLLARRLRRALEPLSGSRASLVLGQDHPLSRATTRAHAVSRQIVATGTMVALGGVAVAQGWASGPRLLGAALLVEFTLVGWLISARQVQREQVLRLMVGESGGLPVEEVSREARRLRSPRHAAELARRLERVFDDAVRWHQLAVTSRPPRGIRLLCEFAAEVDAIVSRLRDGEAALPGLALLELMLSGVEESALYAGDRAALREQLWRVRGLLSGWESGSVQRADR